MKAVDFTNFAGYFDRYVPEAWLRAGFTRAIVGIHLPQAKMAAHQIRTCLAAGLGVEAYAYLYFSFDVAAWVGQVVEFLSDFPEVGRLWLDCEDSTTRAVPKIHEAVEAAGDFLVGIYTRRSWWLKATNDTRDFANLPLWDAYYDGVESFDYFEPYGGWSEPFGKQYQGTTTVPGSGGIGVDLSIFRG